jgi:hypothetical protein
VYSPAHGAGRLARLDRPGEKTLHRLGLEEQQPMNLHAGRPGGYTGEPGQTRAADECQGIEGSSGEERFRNRGPASDSKL